MKRLLFCLFVVTAFVACKDDDTLENEDCTMVGRWIIDGLDESTLYEFTDDLVYTIYSTTPGEFGTIADAIPNPHDYYYEGDTLVVDLNFGNFSRTVPEFKCDCNVVIGHGGTLYKEGYNLADCDE